ncbi:coiled-coil domain-containing protein 77-like isoform X2 [Bacillus rossius redtenbacheri]|uniref:coiled-coil domain-containing protein 77-like isoform X2 n=1 Tax=Bacillus rossius redtenbacheri TaxID=93214 RepID=UPI002FDD328C
MQKSRITHTQKSTSTSSVGASSEQLSRLLPTKELVNYYRSRVIEFEKDYEELLDVVEECKQMCDKSYQLEQELQQCVADSLELRQTVSDLQAYIFQERSEVLRLCAENDHLKLREADARKKIELLLSIHEEYNHKDIPIILSDSSNHPKLVRRKYKCAQKKVKKQQNDITEGSIKDVLVEQAGSEVSDPEVLRMQVLSLSSQLEERTSLFQDQLETLLKDRELTRREHNKDLESLRFKVTSLTKRTDKRNKTGLSLLIGNTAILWRMSFAEPGNS